MDPYFLQFYRTKIKKNMTPSMEPYYFKNLLPAKFCKKMAPSMEPFFKIIFHQKHL